MTAQTLTKPTATALYEAAIDLVLDALNIPEKKIAQAIEDRFSVTGADRELLAGKMEDAVRLIAASHIRALTKTRTSMGPILDAFRKLGM